MATRPCPYCGKKILDTGTICPHCHRDLSTGDIAQIAVAAPAPVVSNATRVSVVDINMPFGSMVVFMIKWAIAAIPAFIILAIMGVVISGLLASLTFGLR